jgi:hypothetical protein
MRFLERKVRTGFVRIDAASPDTWRPCDVQELTIPAERPARILLFLHGTFSSTVGAFGALGSSAWGQRFLERAIGSYDALLGFDHRTLSVDPLHNAAEILEAIEAIEWKHPPRIDVIAHSRGGLVYRSLVEQLLPASQVRLNRHTAIFVGCPNAGTPLAESENWHRLVDLYTNLAVASCRLIGLLPQAKAVTLVLSEIIQGIGAFVKFLASHGLSQDAVPGLAAMIPGGEFVNTLNREQPGQPTLEQTHYCAVTAEFDGSLAKPDSFSSLPRALLTKLTDHVLDRIIGDANDLVVDTRSMTAIDPEVGNYVKEMLNLGRTAAIHHCNYFVRPEVVRALTRWLALPESTAVARRGMSAATRANVIADFGVLEADHLVDVAREIIATRPGPYLVVHRPVETETFYYAFTPMEIDHRIMTVPGSTRLGDALHLREMDASNQNRIGDEVIAVPMTPGKTPSAARSVVLFAGTPVGVVASSDEIADADLALYTKMESMPELVAAPSRVGGSGAVRAKRGGTRRVRNGAPRAAKPRARRRSPVERAESSEQVDCHFQAGMDDEVVVGETVSLEVTMSREAIERADHAISDSASARVDVASKIVVNVSPRLNCEIVGSSRIEMDVPAAGELASFYFDVKGLTVGEGELVVQARQGPVPLVTMRLTPRIVNMRSRRAGRIRTRTESAALHSQLPPQANELRISETRHGDGFFYTYEIDLPPDGRHPGIRRQFKSETIKGDLANYLNDIYALFEEAPIETADERKSFEQNVMAKGLGLYRELIPREMQALLWKERKRIDGIQVLSSEPFIPWEIVFLDEPVGDTRRAGPHPEGRFFAELGLVRWIWDDYPPDRLEVRKDRAFYVIPDYPLEDDKLSEAQKEAEFLERNFGATRINPTSAAVMAKLQEPDTIDLIHFACHGEASSDKIGDACLLMEGRLDGNEYVGDYLYASSVSQLGALAAQGHRPIVVLNACQIGRNGRTLTSMGGFAEAFIRQGGGVFVGTLWSVGDHPARTFTETFYEALRKKKRIIEAAHSARQSARKAGDATWLAYVVYGAPLARFA